jgi:pyrimidine deaminase RibD-like protein
MIEEEKKYMKRALDLAREGAGLVSPNPLVGAVLVKDGRVVGEGFHRYDLLKHAEVHALDRAGADALGATLYCSLEPCCHHGRTPPCTEALIRSGISRAVVAIIDPDPRVNGRGLDLLRDAGIEIETGPGEDEARRINEIYLKFITTGRPFIHAVFARQGWEPSAEFIEMASWYDSIVLGDHPDRYIKLSRAIINRVRHRPIEIATLRDLPLEIISSLDATARVVSYSTPLELRSEIMSRAGVTSVLLLPFSREEDLPGAINLFDKVTVVHPVDNAREHRQASPEGSLPEVALVEREVINGSGYVEVTGYLAKTV